MGFAALGQNVLISDRAAIYSPDLIEIGDNSRIDDFCSVSGRVKIGAYCHVTVMCMVAGGSPGVFMNDFVTLAYGVKVFSQSDDYSGATMANSLIPKEYKAEKFASVTLGRQVIVGTNSVIMPGANIADGCAIGAMSLVLNNTEPWGIYVGSPAVRLKDRSRDLLELEARFLAAQSQSDR
jgi:acetyltransferase-like isoleucine patch superfamily enzyme